MNSNPKISLHSDQLWVSGGGIVPVNLGSKDVAISCRTLGPGPLEDSSGAGLLG